MRLETQPIGLRYFVPAPSLRGIASSYYLFKADLGRYTDVMRSDLPQLRFIVRGETDYHFQDGRTSPATRVTLLGPTYGAYHFEMRGPLIVFGIGLQPAGWAALVGEDASNYANRTVDAEALFGTIIGETFERLMSVQRSAEMGDIADQLMSTLLKRVAEPSFWFPRLVDRWLVSTLSPEVDSLVETIGMSSRQVERLTKRVYGAPPKLLARKYRALKAAAELHKSSKPWWEIAGDAFSDQSHFIRELRQFVGVTPTRLLGGQPPLVMSMSLERRRMLEGLPALTQIT